MKLDPTTYGALADAVLLLHFAVVLFIIGGLLLVLAGGWRNWVWVRNVRFRAVHLAAIGYVVVTTWLGIECALTTLEQSLRVRAGQAGYADDFIAHWLTRIMFYEAQPWVFVFAYSAFGLLVGWSWFHVRPTWHASKRLRERV